MRVAGPMALAALLAMPATAPAQEEAAPAPAAAEGEEIPGWEFNASVYGYFPPEDTDYAQPTVTADRGALHLEGRYNYEGLRVGSVWVGWNFGVGEKLRVDGTLMAGGVFGDTRGFAPGYKLTVSWASLELYSEGEYVVDMSDADNDFFYNWAQLGYSPLDWLMVGFASQRTRAYRTGLDVQRGLFASVTYRRLTLGTYVFNIGRETPTVVASLSLDF
jgi:hypothetical protein